MYSNEEQYGIPCAYIRGGTSKALFFHDKDIPAPGPLQDTLLKRLMGTPDALQIDGMGGSKHSTSKIAIVRPSLREDADVDFTFAQMGVEEDSVSYSGNCGNISSAVGPFAIDEGIVKGYRKGHNTDENLHAREIRIYNTGTKKLLISHVPIDKKTGFSVSQGDMAISGVPGTGSPIFMDYRNTIGGSLAKGLLPSGKVIDTVSIGNRDVDITILDVANIAIFAHAEDLGITGSESTDEINEDSLLISRCKELRGKGAQLAGMCQDWRLVDEQSPGLPFVILVAPSSDDGADLTARLIFMNDCHASMAGTGAICTAACSRVPRSVAFRVLKDGALDNHILRISHPQGIMPVYVQPDSEDSTSTAKEQGDLSYKVLAFVRTSRRIMSGKVFVPRSTWDGQQPEHKPTAAINGAGAFDAIHGVNGNQGSSGVNGTASSKNESPRTMLLAGDINLLNVKDADLVLGKVTDVLNSADVVFANLECMLDAPQHTHSVEHEGFFADPIVGAEVLRRNNISAVGIANNVNYGSKAIMGSIATLDKHGIPHTGAGANITAARRPVVIQRGGRRYGFLQRTSIYWPTDHAADATAPGVAALPGHTAYEAPMYRYHAGIPPVNRPGIPPVVITWADANHLSSWTEDIKQLRSQVDVLVASCHWGLWDEVLTYMQDIAHAAIDAGADVVMGHGPHHPLPVEFYRGKPIFYGLGSFSFHMGHLGMAHGDWVGLLANLDVSQGLPGVSFRFVRHNDSNETYFSPPIDEMKTFEMLRAASGKFGTELWIEGDSVHARPAGQSSK